MLTKPASANSPQEAGRVVRLLVVAAERVRQARVRMAARERVGEPRELSTCGRISFAPSEQLTPTISGCACSIEFQNASSVWPESVRPREVDDRDGDPERQLRRDVLRRGDRRLRVQRVEDRLDEQEVDAALAQGAHLLGIGLDDVVEGDRAVRGIVDLRRERERHVQRPQRARDEPAAGLVGGLRGRGGRPRGSCRARRPRARSRPGRSASR